MARFRRHFLWIAFTLSVLAHFAPVTGPRLWHAVVGVFRPGATASPTNDEAPAPKKYRDEPAILAARKQLVERAMEDRKAGKLQLGRFVLDADALDAEAKHADLDVEAVRRLYDARMQRLRRELEHENADVPRAVERAFDDLAYSTAVNRVSGMLLTKVGACGPTAQLMAAALYDLKERDQLGLRYWGGVNADGATHLTATWRQGAVTYDLASGSPVFHGGKELRADELIEAYARAHGLLPALVDDALRDPRRGESGRKPDVDAAAEASFAYPPNEDVFDIGETPLFAEARKPSAPASTTPANAESPSGIGPRDASGKGTLPIPTDDELWRALSWPLLGNADRDGASVCALDPRAREAKEIAVVAQSGATSIQVIPVLSAPSLAYVSRAIAAYERNAPKKTASDKVLTDACLALSYLWAAERFVAAGYVVIGNEAARRGERHREAAEKNLRTLQKSHGAALAREFPPGTDHWALIGLESGRDLLLEIETRSPLANGAEISPYWSQDRRTRALLLEPKTRGRLLEAATQMPLEYRMHLIGAMASLELGGSDLDLPKEGMIVKAYARYRTFIETVRARPDTALDTLEPYVAVLEAAGATKQQLAEKRRELETMKQRLETQRRERRD